MALAQKAPYDLAVSAAGICWSNLGMTVEGAYNDDGSVRCVAGGVSQQVYDGEDRPYGLVMDATDVYFKTSSPFTIRSVRPDGTGPRVVHVGDGEPNMFAMAIDDTHVYWDGVDGPLRVAKQGGEAEQICAGTWDIRDILVGGERVYFNDFASGRVLSAPKAGGAAMTLATLGKIGNQMALDNDYVYYLGSGDVYRVAKSGGAAEWLGSGAGQYALAVDDDYIFWVGATGPVTRVRKPSW